MVLQSRKSPDGIPRLRTRNNASTYILLEWYEASFLGLPKKSDCLAVSYLISSPQPLILKRFSCPPPEREEGGWAVEAHEKIFGGEFGRAPTATANEEWKGKGDGIVVARKKRVEKRLAS